MASKTAKDIALATTHWDRYLAGLTRGHEDYQIQARLNEDFYIGGGRQWRDDIKAELENAGLPWLEENIIFSTINSVIGTQTQSRMDIAYKPRESGDQGVSDVLSKISMLILDQNKFPWVESQVFADGCIQQRGYLDVRIDFDENLFGEIKITDVDPLDVIPDPDAKTYDPDGWQDVIVTKWMVIDDIKETFGTTKFKQVRETLQSGQVDFGSDGNGQPRNSFANASTQSTFFVDDAGIEHVRVIERQWKKLQMRTFFFDPATGETQPAPDGLTQKEIDKTAKEQGFDVFKRLVQRVRWTLSTNDTVLHDEWSPYDHFTIVPFFPYFRRGVTVGLVDNLIKTQEMLNKTFSQILHIVNSTANSGWILEEDSLTNMDVEDLEDIGSQTGLIVEYKSGRQAPAKIQPNQVPTGLKDLITTGVELIRLISGVSETFQGGKSNEVSGVAIQSKVQQTAVQLAVPIDNLFRTRNMLASRLLKLIQQFYTNERVFLITSDSEEDPNQEIIINTIGENGEVINDVTVGKYDVVIADVPTSISFENAQFSQAVEMRKFGVAIPDAEMVKMSTLSRKNEIAKQLSGELDPEQAAVQKEQLELQMDALRAENEKLRAEALNKEQAGIKAASEVAQILQQNPGIGPILDRILEDDQMPESESSESEVNEPLGGLGQLPEGL